MNTCNKKVKHGMRDVGIVYTSICGKPSHIIDGLCHGHYNKLQKKLTNWIDRKGYRQATEYDLLDGRSLKLSNTNAHKLYKLVNGVIHEWNNDKYDVPTEIPIVASLFCVKV